jgi:hypothetical protein
MTSGFSPKLPLRATAAINALMALHGGNESRGNAGPAQQQD